MANTDSLLMILNTAIDRKKQPQLYQFLSSLVTNLLANEKATGAVADNIPAVGFVTSTIGGTPDTIAMFTGLRNVEDVTATGISNALALLSPSFAHQFLMGA